MPSSKVLSSITLVQGSRAFNTIVVALVDLCGHGGGGELAVLVNVAVVVATGRTIVHPHQASLPEIVGIRSRRSVADSIHVHFRIIGSSIASLAVVLINS